MSQYQRQPSRHLRSDRTARYGQNTTSPMPFRRSRKARLASGVGLVIFNAGGRHFFMSRFLGWSKKSDDVRLPPTHRPRGQHMSGRSEFNGGLWAILRRLCPTPTAASRASRCERAPIYRKLKGMTQEQLALIPAWSAATSAIWNAAQETLQRAPWAALLMLWTSSRRGY